LIYFLWKNNGFEQLPLICNGENDEPQRAIDGVASTDDHKRS